MCDADFLDSCISGCSSGRPRQKGETMVMMRSNTFRESYVAQSNNRQKLDKNNKMFELNNKVLTNVIMNE